MVEVVIAIKDIIVATKPIIGISEPISKPSTIAQAQQTLIEHLIFYCQIVHLMQVANSCWHSFGN